MKDLVKDFPSLKNFPPYIIQGLADSGTGPLSTGKQPSNLHLNDVVCYVSGSKISGPGIIVREIGDTKDCLDVRGIFDQDVSIPRENLAPVIITPGLIAEFLADCSRGILAQRNVQQNIHPIAESSKHQIKADKAAFERILGSSYSGGLSWPELVDEMVKKISEMRPLVARMLPNDLRKAKQYLFEPCSKSPAERLADIWENVIQ